MVDKKSIFSYSSDGNLDIQAWVDRVRRAYKIDNMALIERAAQLTESLGKGLTTFMANLVLSKA